MPPIRTLGFLGFFLLLFAIPVFAQNESSHVSSFHSDYGLKLIKEGNLQQAADQFIQALFFAPSNQVARKNLRSLVEKKDFESKSVKLQILRFVELSDYITFLRERIQKLETENKESIQSLLQEARGHDPRQGDIKEIRRQIENQSVTLIPVPEEIQREYWDRAAKLVRINKYFTDVKESLVSRFSFALSAYERLNTLKSQLAQTATEDQRQQQVEHYEGQLTAAKRELVSRDEVLKQQETAMRSLKGDLAKVRADFDQLHSRLEGTSQKIRDLTDKLADMSMQVYEKDALLAQKNGFNGQLTAELNDAKERWELVQKIIQEKDGQIKNLEEKINEFNTRGASAMAGDQKMGNLSENLAALQTKMEKAEKTNHEMISSLRKELALLQEQYTQLDKTAQEKDAFIERLKTDVVTRDRKLANIVGFFNAYDQDIAQLNGVVEIYRGKLSATHALLTDRDQKVQNLEKQVVELKEKFNKLQQTRVNVVPLIPLGLMGEAEVLQRTKNNLGRLQSYFAEPGTGSSTTP